MDAKEKALRRCVSILRGGLQPKVYNGITVIAVADRLLEEVIQQAADSIAGDGTGHAPAKPYIRIGKGK